MVLAAVLALVAGCSSEPAEPEEPVGPAADGRGPSASDVVWQVSTGSTDVSPAVLAQEVADLTIYGDGRAFVADPTATAGPRRLEVGSVPADDLAAFLTTALDSGAFAPGLDYGAGDRLDLPLTAVVLADGAIPLTAAVVGLSSSDLDLDPDQQRLRDDLAALVAESRRLVVDAEPWTPDRVRAVSIGPDAGPRIDADAAQPWPGPAFDEFPAPDEFSGTSCLLIGEPEVAELWEAALANPSATWTEQDEIRQVVVAPVLPGEEGCPHSHNDEDDDDHEGPDEGHAEDEPASGSTSAPVGD